MDFRDACNIAYPLHKAKYAAEGKCPYCGQSFEKHNIHDVCDSIECQECNRWFVVKTHVEVSYSVHRVEGEVSRLRVAA
jgi:transposase-like protein